MQTGTTRGRKARDRTDPGQVRRDAHEDARGEEGGAGVEIEAAVRHPDLDPRVVEAHHGRAAGVALADGLEEAARADLSWGRVGGRGRVCEIRAVGCLLDCERAYTVQSQEMHLLCELTSAARPPHRGMFRGPQSGH